MEVFCNSNNVPDQASSNQCDHAPRAFTVLELLVVIAIIAILAAMLIPAIAKAKAKSQTTACASNMKNWAYATQLYADDFNDTLPPFGDHSSDYTQPFWHAKLAPYVMRKAGSQAIFHDTAVFRDNLRRCPGGRLEKREQNGSTNTTGWNTWIGAHFGFIGNPLSGAFYYANLRPPVRLAHIPKPSDAMAYIDTVSHYVYSPVEDRYRFNLDMDNDGAFDSTSRQSEAPYNSARPRVHNDGANVTLLDGHVERVAFKSLWKVDSAGRVVHSFWHLED
jgi:prepilin-type N-terminal cleavage/methylation domain-containing protein/prepilin-type processing-associated H-X9-DG protein